MTVATGAEGWRGPSTASHVESCGIDQHYAHNEATCVTCTVLSLHACGTPVYTPPTVVVAVPSETAPTLPTLLPARNDTPAHPPRAPPQLG